MQQRAAIYIRTSQTDKAHQAHSLQKQEEHARELAIRHGLTVRREHVFSDIDCPGDSPPACWAPPDYQSAIRPALAALILAIEAEHIQCILVRKMDRLGTASDTLTNLRYCLQAHNVSIVATREASDLRDDPAEAFAISILSPCIQYDTQEERERKSRLRARKLEEIGRLKDKLARLEAEVADVTP